MQKILTAACAVACGTAAMLAVAAAPTDPRPEASAYVHVGFGGARELPANFHYGLRLDQDRRFGGANPAAIMQLDVTNRGLMSARLNGFNLLKRDLSLNQEEGATAATAGGTTYTAADWALMALGVAGVGYAGYEVSKSHKDDTSGTSTGGGSTTGGGTTGGSTGGGVCIPVAGICVPPGLADHLGGDALQEERASREYRDWLDGGTGQMGDLVTAK